MLNKTPVLDKGYVTLQSTSLNNDELNKLILGYALRKQDDYLCLPHVHIEIKCPLFVQLWLCKYQFHMLTKKTKTTEAYIPAISEIKAKDLETSKNISEAIEATTEALLINPKMFTEDGCDSHIAQIITPINVYNILTVSGSLIKWMPILRANNLPAPIEAYKEAIKNVLEAEWTVLKECK